MLILLMYLLIILSHFHDKDSKGIENGTKLNLTIWTHEGTAGKPRCIFENLGANMVLRLAIEQISQDIPAIGEHHPTMLVVCYTQIQEDYK